MKGIPKVSQEARVRNLEELEAIIFLKIIIK